MKPRELQTTIDSTMAEGTASEATAVAGFEGIDLGRFRALATLGQGGMGVVIIAHDPSLDRRVAIKLLRGRVWARGEAGVARARLQREAQAMARVSHPHVVTVYEVGGDQDATFIVMELVEGENARRWQLIAPR